MRKLLILLLFVPVFLIGQKDTKNTKTSHVKTEKKQETYVLICNSSKAYAYHSYTCRGLNNCKAGTSKITLSEAKAKGYKPCRNCYK